MKALSLESGYCFPNRVNQEITAQLTACKLSIRKCELRKQAPDHEDQHGVGEGRHMIITGEGRLEFEEVVVSVTQVYEAHQSPAVLVVNQIILDMNFIHNKADIPTCITIYNVMYILCAYVHNITATDDYFFLS